MNRSIGSTPVLGFLFAFNLAVAVVAGFVLDFGPQQIATCAGMGAVSLGAGYALLGRLRDRRVQPSASEAVAA